MCARVCVCVCVCACVRVCVYMSVFFSLSLYVSVSLSLTHTWYQSVEPLSHCTQPEKFEIGTLTNNEYSDDTFGNNCQWMTLDFTWRLIGERDRKRKSQGETRRLCSSERMCSHAKSVTLLKFYT